MDFSPLLGASAALRDKNPNPFRHSAEQTRTISSRFQRTLFHSDRARKLKTSQQNISRLESPSYEGHSLSMLRRVAEVLGETIRVTITPREEAPSMILSEAKVAYKIRRKS